MQDVSKPTLPKEQLDYIVANDKDKNINELARELNVSKWTIVRNRYALGLTKPEEKRKEAECNGFFNDKEFFKQYKY